MLPKSSAKLCLLVCWLVFGATPGLIQFGQSRPTDSEKDKLFDQPIPIPISTSTSTTTTSTTFKSIISPLMKALNGPNSDDDSANLVQTISELPLDNNSADVMVMPKQKPSIHDLNCSARLVRLSWKYPNDPNNPKQPDYFVVYRKTNDQPQWKMDSFNRTANEALISVKPNTQYSFRVQAFWNTSKVVVSSDYSQIVKCTSGHSLPLHNPRIVSAYRNNTANAMIVRWIPVRLEDQGAPGFYYKISYHEDKAFPPRPPKYLIADDWKVDHLVIEDTKPNVIYWIRVEANNYMGSAAELELPEEGFAGNMPEKKPLKAPRIFSKKIIDGKTANLTWTPVDFESVQGNFEGYQIKLQMLPTILPQINAMSVAESESNETESSAVTSQPLETKTILVKGNETSLLLDELSPGSNYLASISVRNGQFEGPESDKIDLVTPSDIRPAQPTFIYELTCHATYKNSNPYDYSLRLSFISGGGQVKANKYKFQYCFRPLSDDQKVPIGDYCEQNRTEMNVFEVDTDGLQSEMVLLPAYFEANAWIRAIAINGEARTESQAKVFELHEQELKARCLNIVTTTTTTTTSTTTTTTTVRPPPPLIQRSQENIPPIPNNNNDNNSPRNDDEIEDIDEIVSIRSEESKSDSGSSATGITIVIGAIVAVVAITLAVFFIIQSRKKRNQAYSRTHPAAHQNRTSIGSSGTGNDRGSYSGLETANQKTQSPTLNVNKSEEAMLMSSANAKKQTPPKSNIPANGTKMPLAESEDDTDDVYNPPNGAPKM